MPKKKIVIACHDAGGSEIISAYLKKYQNKFRFQCFVAGPGAGVFRRKKIPFARAPFSARAIGAVLHKHSDAALVLTGTGWMTGLELKFICEAKKQGIRVATYLDHWASYRERFGYPRHHWIKNLPHEIWVGDTSAYRIAHRVFSRRGVRIRLVPNEVFKEARTMYGRAVRHRVKKATYILFVSEPFGASARFMGETRKSIVTEYAMLKSLLSYFSRIKLSKKILIRLHPAELKNKYDALIRTFSDQLDVSISHEPDMYKDLARASTVIGMTSVFLVIAALCKKRVISFFLGKKRRALFFPGITKVKKVDELEKILK